MIAHSFILKLIHTVIHGCKMGLTFDCCGQRSVAFSLAQTPIKETTVVQKLVSFHEVVYFSLNTAVNLNRNCADVFGGCLP